jgi:hypothetical protein
MMEYANGTLGGVVSRGDITAISGQIPDLPENYTISRADANFVRRALRNALDTPRVPLAARVWIDQALWKIPGWKDGK